MSRILPMIEYMTCVQEQMTNQRMYKLTTKRIGLHGNKVGDTPSSRNKLARRSHPTPKQKKGGEIAICLC